MGLFFLLFLLRIHCYVFWIFFFIACRVFCSFRLRCRHVSIPWDNISHIRFSTSDFNICCFVNVSGIRFVKSNSFHLSVFVVMYSCPRYYALLFSFFPIYVWNRENTLTVVFLFLNSLFSTVHISLVFPPPPLLFIR